MSFRPNQTAFRVLHYTYVYLMLKRRVRVTYLTQELDCKDAAL